MVELEQVVERIKKVELARYRHEYQDLWKWIFQLTGKPMKLSHENYDTLTEMELTISKLAIKANNAAEKFRGILKIQ